MSSYSIGAILGGLLIPIVIYLVAILLAKRVSSLAWILYIGGTILTIISLVGEGKQIANVAYYFGSAAEALQSQHTTKIVLFVVLAIGALMIILARAKKETDNTTEPDETDATQTNDETGTLDVTDAKAEQVEAGREE